MKIIINLLLQINICSERLEQTTGVSGVAKHNLTFCLNRINSTRTKTSSTHLRHILYVFGTGIPECIVAVLDLDILALTLHSVTFLNHELHVHGTGGTVTMLQVASCGVVVETTAGRRRGRCGHARAHRPSFSVVMATACAAAAPLSYALRPSALPASLLEGVVYFRS